MSRNFANVALMGSPYAAVAVVETAAAVGPAAVVGGGVAAGALAARTAMRRRETPAARARRELRRAARSASSRTASAPAKNRHKAAAGTLPRLGRKAAAGSSSTRGGSRKAAQRHKAAAGHHGRARAGKTGTGLLDRKNGKRSTNRHGSPAATTRGAGRASRPLGRARNRARFGHGNRATAVRQHAAARRHRGGLLGLRGGGKAPQGMTRRGGLFAGNPGRSARRAAAATAVKRARGTQRSGLHRQLAGWSKSRGARTMRGSWSPFRRLWGRPRRYGFGPAVVRFVGLSGAFLVGVGGAVAGVAMFAPRAWRATRVLGLIIARQVVIYRSGMAAWLTPFSAEQAAERIRQHIKKPSTENGGTMTMSEGRADHVEALIEQVRNAALIEKFAGLHVEAHADAVARLFVAVAEYLDANVEKIKENLPTLDGGESLAQQANIASGAADALSECVAAFSAIHDDRLSRQRDPQAGDENWDISAVQD